MGERRILSVDFRTGGVAVDFRTTETGDATLPFAERMANLRADAIEHLPGEGEVLEEITRIGCDRCGTIVDLDPVAPELPPGWEIVDGLGDLCPQCAQRR